MTLLLECIILIMAIIVILALLKEQIGDVAKYIEDRSPESKKNWATLSTWLIKDKREYLHTG